jgi:hypothetical protein
LALAVGRRFKGPDRRRNRDADEGVLFAKNKAIENVPQFGIFILIFSVIVVLFTSYGLYASMNHLSTLASGRSAAQTFA